MAQQSFQTRKFWSYSPWMCERISAIQRSTGPTNAKGRHRGLPVYSVWKHSLPKLKRNTHQLSNRNSFLGCIEGKTETGWLYLNIGFAPDSHKLLIHSKIKICVRVRRFYGPVLFIFILMSSNATNNSPLKHCSLSNFFFFFFIKLK